MLCALIQNNKVVSVRDLSEDDIRALVVNYQTIIDITNENPQPGVDWVWDGNHFDAPRDETGKLSTIIYRLALRNRLTLAEKQALYGALTGPYGTLIRIYLDDLALSIYVDLAAENTIQGISFLASIGILTADRAHEILTTPATINEIYKG